MSSCLLLHRRLCTNTNIRNTINDVYAPAHELGTRMLHCEPSIYSQVAHMEEEEEDVGRAIIEQALPLNDCAKLLLSSNLWARTGQGRKYDVNSQLRKSCPACAPSNKYTAHCNSCLCVSNVLDVQVSKAGSKACLGQLVCAPVKIGLCYMRKACASTGWRMARSVHVALALNN